MEKDKMGRRSLDSYLEFKGIIGERECEYYCKLCDKCNTVVKKYSESNIPKSCGCIAKLQPIKDVVGTLIEGNLMFGYIGNNLWRVKHSCGHFSDLSITQVKYKKTSLCKKCSQKIPYTVDHGHAKRSGYSPEYNTWLNIKRRCYDENNNRYKYYGGKGISVCDRWLDSFQCFIEDMGLKPDKNYSIERLEVGGDYTPSNCIWVTDKHQANNKTNTILITNTSTEESMSLRHWCELEGLDYKKAHYRFRYKGESVTEILGDNYKLTLDSRNPSL